MSGTFPSSYVGPVVKRVEREDEMALPPRPTYTQQRKYVDRWKRKAAEARARRRRERRDKREAVEHMHSIAPQSVREVLGLTQRSAGAGDPGDESYSSEEGDSDGGRRGRGGGGAGGGRGVDPTLGDDSSGDEGYEPPGSGSGAARGNHLKRVEAASSSHAPATRTVRGAHGEWVTNSRRETLLAEAQADPSCVKCPHLTGVGAAVPALLRTTHLPSSTSRALFCGACEERMAEKESQAVVTCIDCGTGVPRCDTRQFEVGSGTGKSQVDVCVVCAAANWGVPLGEHGRQGGGGGGDDPGGPTSPDKYSVGLGDSSSGEDGEGGGGGHGLAEPRPQRAAPHRPGAGACGPAAGAGGGAYTPEPVYELDGGSPRRPPPMGAEPLYELDRGGGGGGGDSDSGTDDSDFDDPGAPLGGRTAGGLPRRGPGGGGATFAPLESSRTDSSFSSQTEAMLEERRARQQELMEQQKRLEAMSLGHRYRVGEPPPPPPHTGGEQHGSPSGAGGARPDSPEFPPGFEPWTGGKGDAPAPQAVPSPPAGHGEGGSVAGESVDSFWDVKSTSPASTAPPRRPPEGGLSGPGSPPPVSYREEDLVRLARALEAKEAEVKRLRAELMAATGMTHRQLAEREAEVHWLRGELSAAGGGRAPGLAEKGGGRVDWAGEDAPTPQGARRARAALSHRAGGKPPGHAASGRRHPAAAAAPSPPPPPDPKVARMQDEMKRRMEADLALLDKINELMLDGGGGGVDS